MASECPSAKKDPPWLPILPPMPRISVSTNSRARLSHRRPILLSPQTPQLPAAISAPSPLSPPKSVEQSSASTVLETPPPALSSASPSCVAAAAPWPAASSRGVDRADASAAPAAAPSDAVCKPASVCAVSDGDSSGNRSSSICPASEMLPPNSDECISTDGSNASFSVPTMSISMPAALQAESSREDNENGIQESTAVIGSTGGVQEGKYPDSSRPSDDGCTSKGVEFPVAETTSSGTCLDVREEVDEDCRGDFRVSLQRCTDVGREVGISYLVKDAKPVVDEGELEEGQLFGDRVNEAKDLDSGERDNVGCTSSDMEFSVAVATSSIRCLNVPEVDEVREAGVKVQVDEPEVDGGREAGVKVQVESCSGIGRESEIPDLVKNEDFLKDEGELEEGQLSGEWSGAEESAEDEDSELAQTLEDRAAVSSVVSGVPMIPKIVNAAEQNYYSFHVEEVHSEQRSRGSSKPKGKKKKKHKKGEGSKKRAREKSKEKYNEVLKKRRAEGKSVDGVSNPPGLRNRKDSSGSGEQTRSSNSAVKSKKVPENPSQTTTMKPTVDEGPEDGEILLESKPANTGLLSSLVEAEVGLWTTDNVDEQFVTEMEQDGTVKKKRGPETAERKLKRKIAKRKKRAQKERELGIRRPPRTTQSKPIKVLCTHYMKGRCAKGDQCTYSHDAVPLTKLEPCKFLMSHSCLKGDDCPYSHDLRAFPCKFFHTRGLCYDGDNCQFSHGAISEDALEKLKQRVEKEKKDRLSSSSAFDIPTPSFSTPLPPELDPDPLGWGTPGAYSSHEEPTQYANPSTLDQSPHFYGDFNTENHASTSTAAGFLSIDRKDTEFDAAVPLRIDERAAEDNSTQASKTDPLKSRASVDWRGLDRAIERSLADSAYTSAMPQILKTPVCPSLPNERSNARGALEVSKMGGEVDGGQSVLGETFNISNELCKVEDGLCVPSSSVSPLPARIVAPLLRGRQIGSLVVEHQRSMQSLSQAESRRHHTVESLLDEALRQ